jgi:uncharacterized membrane protein
MKSKIPLVIVLIITLIAIVYYYLLMPNYKSYCYPSDNIIGILNILALIISIIGIIYCFIKGVISNENNNANIFLIYLLTIIIVPFILLTIGNKLQANDVKNNKGSPCSGEWKPLNNNK